jgi:AraC family transcriptional regulator
VNVTAAAASTIMWAGLRSEYATLPPHRDATTTGAYQIGIAFSGHRQLVREIDGSARRCDAPPGAVYVTGSSPITWLDVQDPTEALEIYPDLGLAGRLAGGPLELRSALAARDGVVFGLASMLRRVHVSGVTPTDIEGSTLAHRLIGHLVAAYGPGLPQMRGRGQLQPNAVDRVAAYVDANIAGPLTLDALAGTVALSSFHFARSFKAATGLTPQAFVTQHRLMVAKDRLLRSAETVTEIAAAVGFVNVSHFRRLFLRQFGVTPAQLRASA